MKKNEESGIMPNAIDELQNSAKFHGYFWNGLFAALYEPLREQYPIISLTVPGRSYYIPASETTIKNYLSCKTKMDFDCFLEYCHGIRVDTENTSVMQDITPEMLYSKLNEADYYFLPEDAENLTKYRYAEPGTLELYHKIIFSYPEGNIEGMTYF